MSVKLAVAALFGAMSVAASPVVAQGIAVQALDPAPEENASPDDGTGEPLSGTGENTTEPSAPTSDGTPEGTVLTAPAAGLGQEGVHVTQTEASNLAEASGALLRGLDKIAGTTTDLPVSRGQTVPFGQLLVTLRDCRYPADDPASNAYAYVEIREKDSDKLDFEGWMIAASPALSALDHPRYDIWVMRCNNR